MFQSKNGAIQVANTAELTKQSLREKVWSYIEENDLANFPRPVTNRIPNFKGAAEAGRRVTTLNNFNKADIVKVNPDKPQEEVRFATLEAGKMLLVPTPRLRQGLFNCIDGHPQESKETLRKMAQTEGMKKYSKPIGLDAKVKIDLIVIGSVAVSRTGHRIGKGEGFADLEYGMMRCMDAVDDNTVVVTTVHDCQVFDQIPSHLFAPHDVPVDIIVTDTEVIEVVHTLPKPQGIYWNLLQPEKFKQVPILKVLRDQEQGNGKDVKLANGEAYPGTGRGTGRGGSQGGGRGGGGRGGGGRGGGRGRGRGGGRGRARGKEENVEDSSDNIQVTINVSKSNKIVKRTVEATHGQSDRLGSADLSDEAIQEKGTGKSQRPRKPRLPVTYAVFLGKVPPTCRVRELKESLAAREVRPVDITWRGRSGFAFLRFTGPVEDCEDALRKLEGLTLQDQSVVVERAKDKLDKDADQTIDANEVKEKLNKDDDQPVIVNETKENSNKDIANQEGPEGKHLDHIGTFGEKENDTSKIIKGENEG